LYTSLSHGKLASISLTAPLSPTSPLSRWRSPAAGDRAPRRQGPARSLAAVDSPPGRHGAARHGGRGATRHGGRGGRATWRAVSACPGGEGSRTPDVHLLLLRQFHAGAAWIFRQGAALSCGGAGRQGSPQPGQICSPAPSFPSFSAGSGGWQCRSGEHSAELTSKAAARGWARRACP
jgi:hypothetical protein